MARRPRLVKIAQGGTLSLIDPVTGACLACATHFSDQSLPAGYVVIRLIAGLPVVCATESTQGRRLLLLVSRMIDLVWSIRSTGSERVRRRRTED